MLRDDDEHRSAVLLVQAPQTGLSEALTKKEVPWPCT
jgi:hypothetical protein